MTENLFRRWRRQDVILKSWPKKIILCICIHSPLFAFVWGILFNYFAGDYLIRYRHLMLHSKTSIEASVVNNEAWRNPCQSTLNMLSWLGWLALCLCWDAASITWKWSMFFCCGFAGKKHELLQQQHLRKWIHLLGPGRGSWHLQCGQLTCDHTWKPLPYG